MHNLNIHTWFLSFFTTDTISGPIFFHTKGLGGDPSCGCPGKRKFDLKVFFYPLWSPDLSFWCCWESAARTGKSPSSYWSIRYEWREGWSGRSRKGVIFYLSKKLFTNPASGMCWTALVRLWQILKGGASLLQLICSAHVDLHRHLGNKASAFVSFSGEAARDLEAGEPAREEKCSC